MSTKPDAGVIEQSPPSPDPRLVMDRVITTLQKYAFRYATEVQLHRGIKAAFEVEGIPFEHEKVDGKCRYDFLCAGVAVEVKMDRSQTEAYRQVDKYCAEDAVSGVVLVTTKAWTKDAVMRTTVRGKPVVVVRIKGQAF